MLRAMKFQLTSEHLMLFTFYLLVIKEPFFLLRGTDLINTF